MPWRETEMECPKCATPMRYKKVRGKRERPMFKIKCPSCRFATWRSFQLKKLLRKLFDHPTVTKQGFPCKPPLSKKRLKEIVDKIRVHSDLKAQEDLKELRLKVALIKECYEEVKRES